MAAVVEAPPLSSKEVSDLPSLISADELDQIFFQGDDLEVKDQHPFAIRGKVVEVPNTPTYHISYAFITNNGQKWIMTLPYEHLLTPSDYLVDFDGEEAFRNNPRVANEKSKVHNHVQKMLSHPSTWGELSGLFFTPRIHHNGILPYCDTEIEFSSGQRKLALDFYGETPDPSTHIGLELTELKINRWKKFNQIRDTVAAMRGQQLNSNIDFVPFLSIISHYPASNLYLLTTRRAQEPPLMEVATHGYKIPQSVEEPIPGL